MEARIESQRVNTYIRYALASKGVVACVNCAINAIFTQTISCVMFAALSWVAPVYSTSNSIIAQVVLWQEHAVIVQSAEVDCASYRVIAQ
jgi:hypothetical protein